MQAEYKPTLRFDAVETNKINYTAAQSGLKPSEWIRKLILDNTVSPPVADALSVRVAGFDEDCGWGLFHFSDLIAHAETSKLYGNVKELAEFMGRHTVMLDGEEWVDGDALGGVSANDRITVKARAIDLCRDVNRAHIQVELAKL